jgi:hypothetical protein
MKNGFIYKSIKFSIDNLCWLNLVEYFKKIGIWLNPDKKNREMEATYTRVATDIFIVLKWIFILTISWAGLVHSLLVGIVWYLIIANLFTYFFHHIWTNEALSTAHYTEDRIRRRFVNLLLAVAFSNISFAYLFRVPYLSNFSWSSDPSFMHSFWFSISNSLAANYIVVQPITDLGNSVAMIQLIVSFIFVTIIISRSIPQKS